MSVHGTSGWLEQAGSTSGWSLTRGAYLERTWQGPLSTLATFLASVLPGGYSDYRRVDDGELCTVTAMYEAEAVDGNGTETGDGVLANHWEMEGNDLEKSLFEHPKVTAVTETMSESGVVTFRRDIEAAMAGSGTITVSGDLAEFSKRMCRGTEAFSVSQYVLRRTVTVRTGASVAPVYSNVNRRFTYAQITSAEPTLATANLIAASGLTALVWLKRTPKIRQTANALWEIVYEYWGADAWDTWIYTAAS